MGKEVNNTKELFSWMSPTGELQETICEQSFSFILWIKKYMAASGPVGWVFSRRKFEHFSKCCLSCKFCLKKADQTTIMDISLSLTLTQQKLPNLILKDKIIQVQSFSIQSLYPWTKLTRRNERHFIIKLWTCIITVSPKICTPSPRKPFLSHALSWWPVQCPQIKLIGQVISLGLSLYSVLS